MKWIKSKEVFEATNSDAKIIEDIKDILQDLKDEGLDVSVEKQQKLSPLFKFGARILTSSPLPDILVRIESVFSRPYEIYSPTLHQLLGYMKDSGFKICDFKIMYFDNSTFIMHLYEGGRPKFKGIATDPIAWCDTKFARARVKGVDITFIKVK